MRNNDNIGRSDFVRGCEASGVCVGEWKERVMGVCLVCKRGRECVEVGGGV